MNSAAHASSDPPMRGATRVLSDILADLSAQGADRDPSRGQNPAAAAEAAEADATGPKATLGDVIDRLDERAFGFLLLLFALPCCLPFVYLLPQLVALPMLALAAQLAAGRAHPWLPPQLRRRPFSVAAFQNVLARTASYVGWVERFAKPRLRPVTGAVGARIVGALLLVPTASILVPVPSTNTVPGLGVAVASLGLIERDGVLVVVGLAIGMIWVGLLAFLGLEAAQLIKDWISARL